MTDRPLTQLAHADTLSAEDRLYLVQDGQSRQVSLEQVRGGYVTPQDFGVVAGEDMPPERRRSNLANFQDCIERGFDEGKSIVIPPGRYEIEGGFLDLGERSGIRLIGSGRSSIYQFSDDTPILHVGPPYGSSNDRSVLLVRVDGVNLRYPKPQEGKTRSKALELTNVWNSMFRNMDIANAFDGIHKDETPGNWLFSVEFANIRVRNFTRNGIRMMTYEAGSTGSAFTNIYLTNGGSAGRQQCEGHIAGTDLAEGAFNQLNLEWAECDYAMRFATCRNLAFNSVHVEGNRFWMDDGAMLRFEYSCGAVINGLTVYRNTIGEGRRFGIIGVDYGGEVVVNGGWAAIGRKEDGASLALIKGMSRPINGYNNVYLRNFKGAEAAGDEHRIDVIEDVELPAEGPGQATSVIREFNSAKASGDDLTRVADRDFDYFADRAGNVVLFDADLTEDRAITLQARTAPPYQEVESPVLPAGCRVRIVRSAGGAGLSVLNHDGEEIAALDQDGWRDLMFDGANWIAVGGAS